MRNIRKFLVHGWQPTLLYIIAISALASLFVFRLGTLLPGLSESEITAVSQSSSLGTIANNPINAPHKLGQLAIRNIGRDGAVAARIISAGFGLLSVYLFFSIARRWFTLRIAFFGTMLFATSSWVLQTIRNATPDVMLFGSLALVLCGLWLRFGAKRSIAWIATGLVTAICLYIPGLVWFVVGFVVWQFPAITKELRRTPPISSVLSGLFFLLLLTPLFGAIVRDISVLRALAGLPQFFIGWQAFAINLVDAPLQLFVRGPHNPALWLGRLALLDIFTTAMFVLGVYSLYLGRTLDRIKLLSGAFIIGVILVALNGPINITILLPFVYISVTSGLRFFLQRWFTVFPRNPLARSIGLVLIVAAIVVSAAYNTARYFVAWPAAPATQSAFDQKL